MSPLSLLGYAGDVGHVVVVALVVAITELNLWVWLLLGAKHCHYCCLMMLELGLLLPGMVVMVIIM